jgi:hypothetical protein
MRTTSPAKRWPATNPTAAWFGLTLFLRGRALALVILVEVQAPAPLHELLPSDRASAPGRTGQDTVMVLPSALTNLIGFRGCSSAGRALRSQCRGRGFESHHLHQGKPR